MHSVVQFLPSIVLTVRLVRGQKLRVSHILEYLLGSLELRWCLAMAMTITKVGVEDVHDRDTAHFPVPPAGGWNATNSTADPTW